MTPTDLDLFLMSNLSPRKTGLPFVVWISPRGGARHDVRVKVSLHAKAQSGEFVTVSVRPDVRVLEGELPAATLKWSLRSLRSIASSARLRIDPSVERCCGVSDQALTRARANPSRAAAVQPPAL